jgi:hypothetical protein
MKLTLKLILVVCLFSSTTFADGDMPGGGRTCTQNCCTENCYSGNEQPDPITEDPTFTDPNQLTSNDSVLPTIQDYLISLLKEAGSLVNF